ncbi:hypothetical protein C8J56DRAFT_1102890 [Mycena floridula]|nr:hypothetical protein C8J56DRAFT_1102890 [Mycena floridula]
MSSLLTYFLLHRITMDDTSVHFNVTSVTCEIEKILLSESEIREQQNEPEPNSETEQNSDTEPNSEPQFSHREELGTNRDVAAVILDQRRRPAYEKSAAKLDVQRSAVLSILVHPETPIAILFLFEQFPPTGNSNSQTFLSIHTNVSERLDIRFLLLEVHRFADDVLVGRAIVHTGPGYPRDDDSDDPGQTGQEPRRTSPSPLPSLTPSPEESPASPISRALESSDDDSGSSIAAPKKTAMFRYREDPKYATLAQAGSKNPCEISEGLLTPHLIHDFNRKQQSYFLQKGIPSDKQVPKLLACFMENREADKAIDNHRAELVDMDWAQFMKWLKENLLEENWENKLLTELITMKMKQGVAFKTHSNEMVFMNRLLEGTKQHQNDTQLRTAVTGSLPSFLHTFAFDIVAESYEKWALAMRKQIKDDENWGDRLVASNMNSNVASIIQGSAPSHSTSSLQPGFQHNNYQSQSNQPGFSNAPYRSQNQYSNQNSNQNPQNRYHQNQGPYRQSNNNQQSNQNRDIQSMNVALTQPDYPPRLTPDERY